MTDSESRFLKAHLKKHPEYASSAFAVARAWPFHMHDVCERFLRHLASEVSKELSKRNGEMTVNARYERKGWQQTISIFSESWYQYEGNVTDHHSEMRTAIYLECDARQTNTIWGVRRPYYIGQLNESDVDRQHRLTEELGRRNLSNPNNEYLHKATSDPKYTGWASLVGELSIELQSNKPPHANRGEITGYYVNELLDLFDKAVPVLNNMESTKQDPKSI